MFAVGIGLGFVFIPQGATIGLVGSGIFVQISFIDGAPHLENACGVFQASSRDRWVECCDFIVVESGVETQSPSEVFGFDRCAVKTDFHTGVQHFAHIGIVAGNGYARRGGKPLCPKQVFGRVVIPLDGAVKTILEKSEVYTEVPVVVGFPCEVLVPLLHHADGIRLGVLIIGGAVTVCPVVPAAQLLVGVAQIVVAHNAVAQLQLQEVHPLDILQELLLVHLPSHAKRAERAPTVAGSKGRRGIATQGGIGKVAFGIVIHHAAEEAFRHVVVGERSGHLLARAEGIVELADAGGIEVVVVAVEVLVLLFILLVAQQDVEMMDVGKRAVVVGRVALVGIEVAQMVDFGATIDRREACKCAAKIVVAGVGGRHGQIGIERQAVDGGEQSVPLALENVAEVLIAVVFIVAHGVAHDARTGEISLVGVVDGASVLLHGGTVGVANVERIDRAYVVGYIKQVAGRGPYSVVECRRPAVDMGETQPGGELQPILCLIVDGRAAGIAFVFRLVDDSTVIEIAHPGKVVEFAVGTGHRSVVFLTERVVESLVIPVVGRVVVFAVAIAQFGIGVELEVAAYKVFACRHGVHLIAQTAVGAVEQVFVGKGVGLGSRGAMIIFGVEHGTVVGLIILAGIADDIVLRNQT